MSRISRALMFMEMAQVVAKRSTCPRLNVGAIVTHNHRVISIGYNGAPSGEAHCTDAGCEMQHGHCVRAVHAEVNALHHIPEALRRVPDQTLYVTASPCSDCVLYIVKFGISKLYFSGSYRDTGPLGYLTNHGVLLRRIVPSGFILDAETNEVTDEA